MKSFLKIITLSAIMVLTFAISASAQVNVNPGGGSYTTLKDAFDAINAGTHTGAITISIVGDTTETAIASLNASGTGSASYTSIAISPSGGAARTISGTLASSLIDFNGADNVTIDGLNTGGNSLTISNLSTSTTSGTSTVRFVGDATSNTITNCSILGSSQATYGSNGGTIYFAAGAITTGNDNNIISNNNIGPATATLPIKHIYSNGTTTSTTTYNSGNQITGNNIFDFFTAAAQSGGIQLGGGTTDWTISNNKFYQTATRTQTTGAIHAAIHIASSNVNNCTISGNTIGFGAANGTGTYTFVGVSTSSRFYPIYLSTHGTTTATSIQGNTIAGIAISGAVGGTSTSAPFAGILVAAGLANIGNVTGNTIGSSTVAGSISFTSSSTSAGDLYGIYFFPSAAVNMSNNNVGGITATNSSTGTLIIYALRAFTTSSVTNTMNNNTVGYSAAPIANNATGSTSSRNIGIYCQSGACVATGNIVSNLTMSTANVGTAASTSTIGLWVDNTSATIGNNIAQNTIRSISNTNATAAVWATGLHYNASTTGTHTVQRNFIHTISTPSSSATATVNGIYVQAGAATYRNNMIAVGSDMTAQSPQINGINEAAGTDNFYHNSVYIGGSGVAAGTASSFAFNSVVTTNTRNFRDNIFYNARSNGAATSKHYAIRVGGTAANPAGLTSNNNILFAPGTGGFVGLFNAIDQTTLANWQTATGQDANSFSANPQYNDPTNATPDLHLHPANPTVAEGNGADVGVVDDFDGQTRASLTPVDIGADAGNFNGIDLAAPNITYTPFLNTSSTANRVLSVTITDVTGVATGGNAPRIYFNKNAGMYFSTACSLMSGTTQNGMWDCTIDNSLVGGVVATDIIRYFVVAQDTLGNLASNPSAGFMGTDVNNVTTPPTTPNQYTIVGAASGSYNVGTGETYTSLTNTGGIFEFINNSEVTGNITINITSDLTGELGTVALNEFASPFTILIKPSGAPRMITGSNTGALIRLNGADRVRFDGSTAASLFDNVIGGNPALRELTIQNTNTGTLVVVMSIASNGTNGAQNNTVQNINILGQDPTTTLLGISLGGVTPGTVATGPNNNNRIENCSFKRSIFGVYSAGVSAASQNTGTVITMNETSAVTADRIRRVGIVVFNENGVQITENSLNGISTNESADGIGIGLGTQAIDTTTTTTGGVSNALVARNKINGVASLSTTGFSAAGIAVAGTTGGANIIRNNMITGVTAPSTSPDFPAGIFVAGVTGSVTRLYHNSISLTGDRGTVASQMPGYGIAITGTNPMVELKNNIFYNTQTTTGGGANAKSYAIGMVTTTFTNLDSNYNDFWATSSTGEYRSGSLGAGAGTDYLDVTAWNTATSSDANSQELDPVFINPLNDLHLNTTMTPLLGDGITGFATVDYDNDPRPASNPDVGADEVVQSSGGSFPAGTFYNAILAGGDTLAGNATVTNSLTLTGISNTGANTLTLGCDATVTGGGTNNYVVGNMQKQFCTTGSFTFPVGTTPDNMLTDNGIPMMPEYSPFTANVTAVGVVPSSLTVSVVDGTLAGSDPMQSVSRYWDVTETGDLTADISFTYLDQDITGMESGFQVLRRASGMTTVFAGGMVDAMTNTGTAPGVTNFSQWGAGMLAPTAANGSISGQVLTANGQGIRNAVVMVTGGGLSEPRYVQTGSFGKYQIDELQLGQTYVVTVISKRYIFQNPSFVINLDGDLSNINFEANER